MAPPAEWVTEADLDPADSADDAPADGGTRHLLFDEQVDARQGFSVYRRYAQKFVSESGVQEGGQVDFSFDPRFESLVVHRIRLHRDGEVLDRLDPAAIQVTARESGHERQLYDGRLTAIAVLEDIRVGDVLDYEYTIVGANPVFEGRFYDTVRTGWSVPLGHVRYRLLWNPSRPLEIRRHGTDLDPTVADSADGREYLWEQRETAALLADDDLPASFLPYGWIELSEWRDWADVAAWAAAQYDLDAVDALPDDLAAVAGEIGALESPGEKITAALRHIQDSIRYLGMFQGVHSHRPHSLDSIVERRFGDCKDKSLALSALLRHLGFDARPALVESDFHEAIADWLPSPFAFDHVIVRVLHDGSAHWLDATRTFQRGRLDRLAPPDFGRALVVAPGIEGLSTIETGEAGVSRIEVTESFRIPDFGGSAEFDIVTVYEGPAADGNRQWFANTAPAAIEKQFLSYYADAFPRIESAAPIETEDDEEENRFTIRERYRLSKIWTPSDDDDTMMEAEFYAQAVADEIDLPSSRLRTMPFAISHPREVIEIKEIEFPNRLRFDAEDELIEPPALRYRFESTPDDRRLVLRHELRTNAGAVAPGEIDAYHEGIDEIGDLLRYVVWVPRAWADGIPQGEESAPGTAAEPARPSYDPNGPLFAAGLLALIVGTIVAVAVLTWRPSPMAPRGDPPGPVGLGGWLVLLAILMLVSPFAHLLVGAAQWFAADGDAWEAAAGAPTARFAMALGVAGPFLLFAPSLAVLYLFFARRTSFPWIQSILVLLTAALWATLFLLGDADEKAGALLAGSAAAAPAAGAALRALVWVPYLFVSRRVRATFTHDGRAANATPLEPTASALPAPRTTPPPIPPA